MGANESSLEGDAIAQAADDSSSSLSATGAASAYDAPPEAPEAEAPAEAASPGDEPPELLCPITLSMMGDPVVANDGHSYERAAIATWLATHDTSPLTGEVLEDKIDFVAQHEHEDINVLVATLSKLSSALETVLNTKSGK